MVRNDTPLQPVPENTDTGSVTRIDQKKSRRLITIGEFLERSGEQGCTKKLEKNLTEKLLMPGATDKAQEYTFEILTAVLRSAAATAQSQDLDSISAVHITNAYQEFVRYRKVSRQKKYAEVFGGIFTGASISYLLTVQSFGENYISLILTVFAGLIGAFLIGYADRATA